MYRTDSDPGDEASEQSAVARSLAQLRADHQAHRSWRPADVARCRHRGVIGSLVRCVCGWMGGRP